VIYFCLFRAGLRIGTKNGIRDENARGHDTTPRRLQTSDAIVASRQELVDVQRKDDRLHRRIAPKEPRTAAVSDYYYYYYYY